MPHYEVHPEDEMQLYLKGLGRNDDETFREYMDTGFGIRSAIRELLQRVGRPLARVDSMLDFASGHGRATRFLLEDVPVDRLTISDLYPTAVAFQRESFGVRAFESHMDPDALEIPDRYDVITCISLFTHLPESLFERWLGKLLAACRDDGVLLLTTVVPDQPGEDYEFEGYSESRSIDTELYGTTRVSFAWVDDLLRRSFPGRAILAYAPRGLVGHQDIYVIGPAGPALQRVDRLATPRVELDRIDIEGDRLLLAGWASSLTQPAPVRTITIRIDDRDDCEVHYGLERPDVVDAIGNPGALKCGFHATMPYDDSMRDAVVSIEVDVPGELPRRRHWRGIG